MDKFRMWNPSIKKYTYFSRPELVGGVSYGLKSEMMSGMIFHADGPMYITPYDEPEWCTNLYAAKSYRGDSEDARLVFEGDIIKAQNWGKCIVKYGHRYRQCAFIVYMGSAWDDLDNLKEIEIIGTIHTRPELLGREKGEAECIK